MIPFLDGILRLALFGTPFIAGFTLLAVLFVKAWRPAIAGGFMGAIFFGFIGLASVGDVFHPDSGPGSDWAAALAAACVGLYVCSGFIFGVGIVACISPRHRFVALILLLIGLLLPIGTRFRAREVRIAGERHWLEEQELQRKNPHALVNDIALPDAEDSGYRIRYVDNHAVIRESNALMNVTSYVVLPPGKHWLTVKADTPKGEKLKLPIIGEQSVEVQAGDFYNLQVANGKAVLVEVSQNSDSNKTPEPRQP